MRSKCLNRFAKKNGFGDEVVSCSFPGEEVDEAPIDGVRIYYFDEGVDVPLDNFLSRLSDLEDGCESK